MDQNIAGYQFDDVFIDLKNRQVRRDNQVYPLNAKYYRIEFIQQRLTPKG